MIEIITILVSLLVASGAAYAFLQWKSPTRKEKLASINEKLPEQEFTISNLLEEEITQTQITLDKKKLATEIAKTKQIQKKKAKEISEKEQERLESLPYLEETQALLKEVAKKEDLAKRVYSSSNLVYAAALAVLTFLASQFLGNLLSKKLKGEVN